MDEADGGLLRPCSSRAVECVSKQPYLLKEEVDEELGVYRAKVGTVETPSARTFATIVNLISSLASNP